MGSHETQERKSEAIEELLFNRTGIMTNPELSVGFKQHNLVES